MPFASLRRCFVGICLMIFLHELALANTAPNIPEFVPEGWLLKTATGIFGIAVLHTFLTKLILGFAHRFPKDSVPRNILHFLGEVEVVFGFWAFVLIAIICSTSGTIYGVSYLKQVNFTEPAFVFVIMCMAATKPIIQVAGDGIGLFARLLPLGEKASYYIAVLILGPLLGSFIIASM